LPGGRPLSRLFHRLRADPAWTCQAKIDGQRVLFDGEQLWSSGDNPLPVPAALTGAPPLDGELERDGTLWLFDLPDHGGMLADRLVSLAQFVAQLDDDSVRMIPTCTHWDQVDINGWEGVVFKRLSSAYRKARSDGRTDPNWIKYRAAWL
jgi:ATP-dependent DNA ligase